MSGATGTALRSSTSSPFDGLANRSLGGAQLDASGGTLTVSNIGSSGEDGVSIEIPDCELFDTLPLAPESTPDPEGTSSAA